MAHTILPGSLSARLVASSLEEGEGLQYRGTPCTNSFPGFCRRMDIHAMLVNGGNSEAARPSREFTSYPLLRHPAAGTRGTGSCPVRLGAPPARPRGGGVCGPARPHGS